MKKFLLGIFVAVIFFGGIEHVLAVEKIDRYDIDIKINYDASITVVEKIEYDFGDEQRHGIFRDIPVKYETQKGHTRKIRLSEIAVEDDAGGDRPWKREKNGRDARIRIGDANRYVTGTQKYVITYTVNGAMNYFDTHDELYWNAIGNQWDIPIFDASVTVTAPNLTDATCFSGVYGSTESCDNQFIKSLEGLTVEGYGHGGYRIDFEQKKLAAHEGLTVVIGMPAGTVHEPTVLEKILLFMRDNWIVGIPLVVAALMYRWWFYHGKDPRGRGTIVPQYEVPDDLTPAEIGTIVDEKAHSKDVSATIIDLAVRGYLTIEKTTTDGILIDKDDYIFHKKKDGSDLVNSFERTFLTKLFDGDQQKKLSDLKNTFYTDLAIVTKEIYATTEDKKYFVKDPQKVRAKYIGFGVAGLFVSVWGGGFLSEFFGTIIIPIALVSSLIILLFGIVMPKRTRKGVHAREHILGLKQYLDTAEKDRIAFHNAPEKMPEKTPAEFEKLLPVAMALGVEKAWAKQFEGIYRGSPSWYQGGAQGSQMNAPALVRDLGRFNTASAATMSSRPSSAGSGGSGFSGGGSGGGMGGGGGGSW